MASQKDRILKEIEESCKKHGYTRDREICKWFVRHAKSSMQVNTMLNCRWVDNIRIWSPTETLRDMYEDLQT